MTDAGPADYVLFVDGKPCGVIEAKKKRQYKLNEHEEQSEGYALAKLKHLHNDPLPFVYISTGELTRFTDFTDPKPRAREVFSFHRPETLRDWLKKEKSLRKRFHDLPLQTRGLRDCQTDAIRKLETLLKKTAKGFDTNGHRIRENIRCDHFHLPFTEICEGKTGFIPG